MVFFMFFLVCLGLKMNFVEELCVLKVKVILLQCFAFIFRFGLVSFGFEVATRCYIGPGR